MVNFMIMKQIFDEVINTIAYNFDLLSELQIYLPTNRVVHTSMENPPIHHIPPYWNASVRSNMNMRPYDTFWYRLGLSSILPSFSCSSN